MVDVVMKDMYLFCIEIESQSFKAKRALDVDTLKLVDSNFQFQ
jgi:hypothetical protein